MRYFTLVICIASIPDRLLVEICSKGPGSKPSTFSNTVDKEACSGKARLCAISKWTVADATAEGLNVNSGWISIDIDGGSDVECSISDKMCGVESFKSTAGTAILGTQTSTDAELGRSLPNAGGRLSPSLISKLVVSTLALTLTVASSLRHRLDWFSSLLKSSRFLFLEP